MTEAVGVIGGGTMGVGIAYVSAIAGYDVHVAEPDDAQAAAMVQTIATTLDGAVARGKLSGDAREAAAASIHRVAAIEALPAELAVLVESVPERLDLKRDVLARAAARSPRLLATNTSAMSIDTLAQSVADPSRFLGLHFFNPVWSLKLLEIVVGAATTDAALADARAFGAAIGKEVITVRDVPGFATSRLDFAAALEAMRMLEDGVASAEDIDRAAVLAYRHPVGPLRLSDIVGLDVRLEVARTLEAAHGSRFAPPAILSTMVAEGRLGAKSGRGFFDWPA
ncbi:MULTISPECIES: 3-hydroxyacyl-CoA dehydrogenase family protein [Sphingomonas]|uniref:3-hydroxyacyl-CoA dehydrogenase family protein n=1 Tax=Sphingomonas TaxID=13687 RepID=UPI00082C9266|nr:MULTISPECIES: 3-hydroxyacyl-CoA dehydrogenase family protein [Sphingomonas]MBY0301198.1 3-hydroxyacyl-CoA dehydrogenase family protein [Sphingomonas ginsenosidimutans]